MGKKSCSVAVLLDIISGFHPEQIVKLQLHNRKYNFRLTEGRSSINDTIEQIQIFPNPSSELITINSSKEISVVEIYNGANQVVLRKNANNEKIVDINISQLTVGIYYASVNNVDGETKVKKLIVIK